jgi:hypothetical protein
MERQLLRNTREFQEYLVQSERAHAEQVVVPVHNRDTNKGYKVKTRKTARDAEKARSLVLKSAEETGGASASPYDRQQSMEEMTEGDTTKWRFLWHIVGKYAGTPSRHREQDDPDRVFWAKPGVLLKDGAGALVRSYIKENCKYSLWLDVMKKINGMYIPVKRKKVKADMEKHGEVSVVKLPMPKGPTVCHQDLYEEYITYKAETNAAFCNNGYYLSGVRCAGCGEKFVADRYQSAGYKPAKNFPVHCCVHIDGQKGG